MRTILKALAILIAASLMPLVAHAQSGAAIVVSACGTAPSTYVAGQNRQVTQDTNGYACVNGGTGGGATAANQTPAIFWNEATGAGSALTGSATFTGTARDVGVAAGSGHGRSYFVATFAADQGGTANIQCSNDNSTWRTIATNALTAGSPLVLSVPITTRYYRAQVVNGSSAETYLWVDDSFTGA